MTKARPLGEEIYIGVKANRKAAEKALREMYPYMRKVMDGYAADKDNSLLLFITEEEVS